MRFRSLLFVPGSRPDRFAKAIAAGADDVIIDLEDAVAPADKAQAREAVRAWLSAGNTAMVRVNSADTQWFSDDLSVCALAGVTAVVLPKAEHAADILRLSEAGAKGVLPLVETAAGIDALDELARAPNVLCLAFGSLDLQVDLGMRGASEDDLGYFRSRVVLASRLAGLPPPVDGISPAIDDVETLRVDVARSRRMGFGGKLCIHPRQIAEVRSGFSPTVEEVAWARKIVHAVEVAGGAVVNVDGKMVDKPVLLRALAILRDSV